MSHAPRRQATLADPGRLKLADSISPPPADPRLETKLGRALPAGIEPLLPLDDLAAWIRCSRRLVERKRAAGHLPKPDLRVGKMPRWRVETIRRWIEGGGNP